MNAVATAATYRGDGFDETSLWISRYLNPGVGWAQSGTGVSIKLAY